MSVDIFGICFVFDWLNANWTLFRTCPYLSDCYVSAYISTRLAERQMRKFAIKPAVSAGFSKVLWNLFVPDIIAGIHRSTAKY